MPRVLRGGWVFRQHAPLPVFFNNITFKEIPFFILYPYATAVPKISNLKSYFKSSHLLNLRFRKTL